MKVVLRADYQDLDDYEHRLVPDVEYDVLGISSDYYRIINCGDEPILYPSYLFIVVDATRPDDWITQYGDDGEEYSYPPPLGRVGFFEDYFDDDETAIREFWEYVRQQKPAMNSDVGGLILRALTTSSVRRDRRVALSSLSDESLIGYVVHAEPDARRMDLLVSVARLLRLMDSLLAGSRAGADFVGKFSDRFQSIDTWDADPLLDEAFDLAHSFFSEIQLFSSSDGERQEEPALFDDARLITLTEDAYSVLRGIWCQAVVGRIGP